MNSEPLSVQGQNRRGQILLLAKAEARRRRRRRFTSRGIGVVALLAVAILVFDRTHPTIIAPLAPPSVVQFPQPQPTTPPSSVVIEYVQTDPTITDRLTIPPQPPRWTSIGDAELLQELAAAGQPAGIAWIDGKAILLPREPMR
jgi:hypothetical protein